MIKIYTGFCLVLLSLSGFGQQQAAREKDFSISVGLSLAIPARNLQANTIGGGFDVLGRYTITQQLAATADVGVTALAARFNIPTTAVVPIRLGLQYYPAEKVYLLGKAGLGIFTLGDVISENYAAWALGAGYVVNNRFDIAAAFEGFAKKSTDFGYVSLRVGYTFGK